MTRTYAGRSTAPYRWDLVRPDELGTLLRGTEPVAVHFAAHIARCAGQVLARSAHGDLVFVGRSLDSVHDVLSGVMSDLDGPTVTRAPLSFSREWDVNRGRPRRLTRSEVVTAREVLADAGVTPRRLTHGSRPLVLVDVVFAGRTFRELYALVRDWIEDDRAQWDVARRKLRFLAVTAAQKTSPHADRWGDWNPWTDELPASAVSSISVSPRLWSHLGDQQQKITGTYRPRDWGADRPPRPRDDATRQALAEAVGLVAHGRSRPGRAAMVAAMAGEPAMAETWLRDLRLRLSRARIT